MVISTENKGVEELEAVCKEITTNSDVLQCFLCSFPEDYVNLIDTTIETRILEYTKLPGPLFVELMDLVGIRGNKSSGISSSSTVVGHADSLNETHMIALGKALKVLLQNIADPNRMRKALKNWNNIYPIPT